MLKKLLAPLASLKLTIALLAMSMILIYAGTWAQVDAGIWQVQKKYFHSVFCWISFQTLLPRPRPGQAPVPGGFPMLGGYTIGLLLLLNLIAAHVVRFQFTARRLGIIFIHLGLILLLAGEGVSSRMQRESQMTIDEGSFANYGQDIRSSELAIVEEGATEDIHRVIADRALRSGRKIQDARLPFDVKVDAFYRNSQPVRPQGNAGKPMITDADGSKWTITERPVFGGADGSNTDVPSAFVTIARGGQELGSFLLTAFYERPQPVTIDGRTYNLYLRFTRDYKPYTIYLKDFSHDRYQGTDVAKNFSSDVKLVDRVHHETREVRIWMNHPLRYRGETFFQASFKPGDKTTVLQIVSNPGWLLPYIAIGIAGFGLLDHFLIALSSFLLRRRLTDREVTIAQVGVLGMFAVGTLLFLWIGLWGLFLLAGALLLGIAALVANYVLSVSRSPRPAVNGARSPARRIKDVSYEMAPAPSFWTPKFLVPAAFLAIGLIYAAGHAMPQKSKGEFDLQEFGALPVSFDGRTQPIDTLARNALKVMRGRESALLVSGDEKNRVETTIKPIDWILDVLVNSEKSRKYKVFRIDHDDVKTLFKLDVKEKFFSIDDLAPSGMKIQEQMQALRDVPARDRSAYQRALSDLGNRLMLYQRIADLSELYAAPPLTPGEGWKTLGEADQVARQGGAEHPAAKNFLEALRAHHTNNAPDFNKAVRDNADLLAGKFPGPTRRAGFEAWFNRFDPFTLSMVFYLMIFVLAALSWLGWSRPLSRSAFWLLCLALVVHTFGLGARIYISGRPPVTNLASSAIFIGWGAAIFAAVLELIFRNGIGSVAAAIIGFPTLMIAYKLSLTGDTMAVLQAVLDTNIWLATHVVTITLGYAATFLAGLIAILYIVMGVFTKAIDDDGKRVFGRMIFGVTCFAIFFSFIGTILGGIWADQSWGRFWGWDPKENGAVLIVLANAILVHARWAGIARERGLAVLAIFGNIVTAWSWFGTNMLGVGLHAYGFMDAALMWLFIFVASQLLLIGLAATPVQYWRSFAPRSGTPVPETVGAAS